MIIHDQAIFDAIAAATDHNDDGIFINVQTFIDTFNNHRDRKLCTSLDSYEVMHLKAMLANDRLKTVPVEERNRIAQTPADEIECLRTSNDQRGKDLATVIAQRDAAEQALRAVAQAPSGLANLCAIVADQPFQNSALSVYEINLILANTGSFMPDEAVMWFRASRGTFGVAQTPPEGEPR